MKTLLIVYHSMTGGTLQMANAAAAGAARAESALHVLLLQAAEANAAHVLGADGYVFATPENLAAMSGQMKDFSTAPTTRRWSVSTAGPMQRSSVLEATAVTRRNRLPGSRPDGACGRSPIR